MPTKSFETVWKKPLIRRRTQEYSKTTKEVKLVAENALII
jgi:hypothetical protein